MKLTLKRDQFLSNLFSTADINDDEDLSRAILAVYAPVIPDISIETDRVVIILPDTSSQARENDFFRAVELCKKGKYAEAIPVFESLREALKTDSEYFRNYAQAYEEIGDHNRAVDLLIEALRFDPANRWALLLMGNIYVKYHNDLDTAYTYFEKVIEADPKNHIVLSNIGGLFLKAEKYRLAERFFKKALESNNQFPNALHGMGILNHQEERYTEALDFGSRAMRNAENGDQEKVFFGFMTNLSSDYIKKGLGKEALEKYKEEVRKLTSKGIRYQADNSINTEARIEIAENHKRDYHLVLYRDNVPFVDHLIAHELTHLKYIEEARREGLNKVFTSGQLEKSRFIDMMASTRKKLVDQGLIVEKIDGFIEMVFHGTNSRIYNAPIDLFIEDHIYRNIPELRPQQFLSLTSLGKLAHQSVTDPSILAMTPTSVISKIKVYNALSARHFDELYGVKTEKDYPVNRQEKELIDQFWDEFNEYRNDREAGEEYELLENWGKDLELDGYFKLMEEVQEKRTLKKDHSLRSSLRLIKDRLQTAISFRPW